MKKQTLKEFMTENSFPNGVCIGSKSSFFYIGEAEYDKVEERLDKYVERTKRNLEDAKSKLRYYALNAVEITDDNEVNEKKIEARINHFISYCGIKNSTETYLKHYIPLDERVVKDSYVRETDERTVIIIDGNESGDLWFAEEM